MPSTDKPILRVALAVVSLLVILYSMIIAQYLLLGIATVVSFWAVYLLNLLVSRLGRIASALELLAEDHTVEYEN